MYAVLCLRNIVLFDCGFHNEILPKQFGIEKSRSVKNSCQNSNKLDLWNKINGDSWRIFWSEEFIFFVGMKYQQFLLTVHV